MYKKQKYHMENGKALIDASKEVVVNQLSSLTARPQMSQL
jgi:hypothetical protein